MSSFEVGASRPVGAVQAKAVAAGAKGAQAAPQAGGASVEAQVPAAAGASTSAAPQVQAGKALDAGAAPVDGDRVATIRKAIEEGRYPVIPVRVADAMIAAGMLWRTPQ